MSMDDILLFVKFACLVVGLLYIVYNYTATLTISFWQMLLRCDLDVSIMADVIQFWEM